MAELNTLPFLVCFLSSGKLAADEICKTFFVYQYAVFILFL
jgi:hypothetical protein